MNKFAPFSILLLLLTAQIGTSQSIKAKKLHSVQSKVSSQVPTPSEPNPRDPQNPSSETAPSGIFEDDSKPYSGVYPPRDSVFTLPLSTHYRTPITIQRILMEMMTCYPKEAGIWRDEYKVIYDNKNLMNSWLIQKIKEKQLFHQNIANQQRESELKCREAAEQHDEEANYFARRIIQQWAQTYESSQASFHIQQRDAMRQKADALSASQEAQMRAVTALSEWIRYCNSEW